MGFAVFRASHHIMHRYGSCLSFGDRDSPMHALTRTNIYLPIGLWRHAGLHLRLQNAQHAKLQGVWIIVQIEQSWLHIREKGYGLSFLKSLEMLVISIIIDSCSPRISPLFCQHTQWEGKRGDGGGWGGRTCNAQAFFFFFFRLLLKQQDLFYLTTVTTSERPKPIRIEGLSPIPNNKWLANSLNDDSRRGKAHRIYSSLQGEPSFFSFFFFGGNGIARGESGKGGLFRQWSGEDQYGTDGRTRRHPSPYIEKAITFA